MRTLIGKQVFGEHSDAYADFVIFDSEEAAAEWTAAMLRLGEHYEIIRNVRVSPPIPETEEVFQVLYLFRGPKLVELPSAWRIRGCRTERSGFVDRGHEVMFWSCESVAHAVQVQKKWESLLKVEEAIR